MNILLYISKKITFLTIYYSYLVNDEGLFIKFELRFAKMCKVIKYYLHVFANIYEDLTSLLTGIYITNYG